MKWRRIVLGAVVFGGVLMLVLGVFGVFAPGEEAAEADVEEDTDSSGGETGGQVEAVITAFSAEGENWTLTAEKARSDTEMNARMTRPVLTIRREREGEAPEQITITANTGVYQRTPKERVTLEGNVVVDFAGEPPAVLTTERLEVNPEAETAMTDALVTLSSETREGHQKITAQGAEFRYQERLLTLPTDIRAELHGEQALLPGAEGLESAAPKATEEIESGPALTIVTCTGPCIADGFRDTIVLENDVVLRQKKGTLKADRMEGLINRDEREVERFVAEGNVRFSGEGISGDCTRLVRSAADGALVMSGTPAAVTQGASRIEAERLELDPESGRLFAPSKGTLVLAPPEEDNESAPMVVDWLRFMRFDRAAHEAVFSGDVEFTQEGRMIQCQTLTVQFDESNQNLVECRAEEDVHVRGAVEGIGNAEDHEGEEDAPEEIVGSSREMILRPEEQTVVFAGDAILTTGDRTIRGERIIMDQRKESLRVEGAGSLESASAAERDGPMRIAWQGEMTFDPETGEAVFRRDVSLSQAGRTLDADIVSAELAGENRLRSLTARGNAVMQEQPEKEGDRPRRIRADSLEVRLNEANEFERLEAIGDAEMHDGRGEARGDRMIVTDAGQTVQMTGPGSMNSVGESEEGEPQEITVSWSGDMAFRRESGEVVFRRDVALSQNERTLRADRVVATLSDENELQSVVATGDAMFEESGRTARGERLEYDAQAESGLLSGEPAVLQQGTERVFGTTIAFGAGAEEVRVTSDYRVEAIIVGSGEADISTLLP